MVQNLGPNPTLFSPCPYAQVDYSTRQRLSCPPVYPGMNLAERLIPPTPTPRYSEINPATMYRGPSTRSIWEKPMDNRENTNALSGLSNGLADAVERVGTSLVTVHGRQRQSASGVVFADNLVVTADHVIEREEDLTIQTHDGRTLPAQFAGRAPSSDIADLRVADRGLSPAAPARDPAVGQR